MTSVSPDSIPFGETGSPDTYTYDANGNMTCRIENGVVYTHTYNAENRASSIAKRNTDCTGTIIESWSFAYDGDGVRVSTAHFTGTSGTPDSTTSYFMGGQFEVKDGATKKYYSIAGMMVATQDASGLQYLLTDHLGSTVAVTNASGTLTSQQRYLPFGAPRTIPNSPILGTDFTYTGQRKLDDGMGGIMDYKARFYSPALMRFIQPDTIIPDQFNPQSWNRFGYVQNNPIRFNDPTGHMLDEGDGGGCYKCTPSPEPEPDGCDNLDCELDGGCNDGTDGDDADIAPIDDNTVFVTNLDPLDLIFDPFYGTVWYGFTQGNPESAFEYRRMLRELMMSGYYGPDSYAILRLHVALALPQGNGKPGSNNFIPSPIGDDNSALMPFRMGWEPYDLFLSNMGLGTGPEYAANYEPYFLQGLMNTESGKLALELAKQEYLSRRDLSTDAELLDYLMTTCSGCVGD